MVALMCCADSVAIRADRGSDVSVEVEGVAVDRVGLETHKDGGVGSGQIVIVRVDAE